MTKEMNQNLYNVLSKLKTSETVGMFLKDLCTPTEIDAMGERLELALLLDQGNLSYRDISHMTGASTTTVARVARFLKTENYGGYRHIMKFMNTKKDKKNVTKSKTYTGTAK